MRGYLASAIGVTCMAALALPTTLSEATAAPRPAPVGGPSLTGSTGTTDDTAPGTETDAETSTTTRTTDPDATGIPGSTESVDLAPLSRDRALGATLQGLPRRDVQNFSLLGVIWDDPDTELHGRVQVRTRSAATGVWSDWQDLETHNAEHAADPDTAERSSPRVRGATAPLWVGESDGVEVRVQAQAEKSAPGEDASHAGPQTLLPAGLRIELIDPGRADGPQSTTSPASDTSATSATPATSGTSSTSGTSTASGATVATVAEPLEIPALSRTDTERELALETGAAANAAAPQAKPYIGPRPKIVTRKGWGADENLREKTFLYTNKVKAAFVHHTATGNNYTCAEASSVIRGIYRYHVGSMGWRDIGYNFLVDKCGNIYEGRAGGVAKPVLGAHTLGFNTDSMGIAVIGSYSSTKPAGSAVTAVARLSAWKLGLSGANPKGTTYLKSGGGNLYKKGKNVRLNVISGHRDGFATDCPGGQLYGKLGTARADAARLQGR
ncbi:peptidoglycan recognition protein [Streptomyces sp. NPDC056716]|uniref:peptidoglycan recognition protein family protein n=1 Tax=unclassified Streptomyces TaxID=2593676 RepID=UPI0036A16429